MFDLGRSLQASEPCTNDLVILSSASFTSVTGWLTLLGCFGALAHSMPCQAVVIIAIMGPTAVVSLSVPCSFLESICGGGIRTWWGGVGAGQEWAAVGSRVLDLFSHPPAHGSKCFPPFLNIVVLALRHHWEEKGRQLQNHHPSVWMLPLFPLCWLTPKMERAEPRIMGKIRIPRNLSWGLGFIQIL